MPTNGITIDQVADGDVDCSGHDGSFLSEAASQDAHR